MNSSWRPKVPDSRLYSSPQNKCRRPGPAPRRSRSLRTRGESAFSSLFLCPRQHSLPLYEQLGPMRTLGGGASTFFLRWHVSACRCCAWLAPVPADLSRLAMFSRVNWGNEALCLVAEADAPLLLVTVIFVIEFQRTKLKKPGDLYASFEQEYISSLRTKSVDTASDIARQNSWADRHNSSAHFVLEF